MSSRSTDFAAIGLSGLCLMHCLALPMVVSLSPILGLAAEEWVHGALAVAASFVSLAAMARLGLVDNRGIFLGLAMVGIALLLSAAFIEALETYETPLTVAGASVLALAHVIRWRSHA